eukprot:TRINITY_DN1421_c0_g1_i1.p1 TRINITY_DN1421_c0_g1~~TRINITY_DN1421_c0_g1_i1.p1  ORF type:complete len:431 (-),score=173.00 TRINITY_DN1421_c0_g1_i1:215-1507(-)
MLRSLARSLRSRTLLRPSLASTRISPFSATADDPPKTSLLFTVPDQPGTLQDALNVFSRHGVNLSHIESRPNKRSSNYDFFVDFDGASDSPTIQGLIRDLKSKYGGVTVMGSKQVPWFPRKLVDLDVISQNVLGAGAELEADHPGFHDPVYRARRKEIVEQRSSYRIGKVIPQIKYTTQETETWRQVWRQLIPMTQKHGCAEYNRMFPLLMQNCGYREDNIPQLHDISQFLKDCSGFTIYPIGGLLSARDFLNGLAFRVFFSTQYIRHHSRPLYTPEPDIVHELVGHVPLFADQNFADFSQEIGLASIGATDEQILKLARCYWFSVEFGLCEQHGERKAYGAGLLSSFGELEYSMSSKPEIRDFDPFHASNQDYPITSYQPLYYMAKSFEEAKQRMREFSDAMERPFYVRYNALSQSLQVDRNIKVQAKN